MQERRPGPGELIGNYTRLLDGVGGVLFGRTTYELMERAWPAVAREPKARPADRAWFSGLSPSKRLGVTTRVGTRTGALRSW